ncbi:MAG: hypothetical protein ACOYCB_14105 [Fastidiosipilaceae bacterium]|jgi:hypothetical protein
MNRQQFDPRIKAEIRRIAPDAIARGWTSEMLWENRFWNIVDGVNRSGLAACMRPGDKITDVTGNYIEISREEKKTRFYHPDKEFPWKKYIR